MPQTSPVFEVPLAEPDAKKPWERQDGEPARWFMRFRNYLRLGPRRSVNAVFERERMEKAGKVSSKVGSRWYDTALRWQWEARAEAYDAYVDEQQAQAMRDVATHMPFVSRPFRLVQLSALAEALMRHTEHGMDFRAFIVCVHTMQSLMRDIAEEVKNWGVSLDAAADSAAMTAYSQKHLRLEDLDRERELDLEMEIDRKLAYAQFLTDSAARARALQQELSKQATGDVARRREQEGAVIE